MQIAIGNTPGDNLFDRGRKKKRNTVERYLIERDRDSIPVSSLSLPLSLSLCNNVNELHLLESISFENPVEYLEEKDGI